MRPHVGVLMGAHMVAWNPWWHGIHQGSDIQHHSMKTAHSVFYHSPNSLAARNPRPDRHAAADPYLLPR